MTNRNQKTIYISEKYDWVWEKIKSHAVKDGRGVGDYLCRLFEKTEVIKNDKS